eukprot:scaffold129464_cov36-Phaeocystis_antarctica.AAC.1
MAAKDKVCGNNLVALKDLDLGAWIDRPYREDGARRLDDVDCEDQRWTGAPDATNDLKRRTSRGSFDPCADVNVYAAPWAWVFAFFIFLWGFQCSYLVVLIQRARRAMLFDMQSQALVNMATNMAMHAVAAPAAVPVVVDVDTDAA